MGSLIRMLIGVPGAVLATIVIFLFMWGLVKPKPFELGEKKDPVAIDLGRKIQDTDTAVDQSQFQRPSVDTPPPPPPAINNADFAPSVDGVAAVTPEFDANVDIGTGFNPDRDAQPLVRIPPQFPERCQGKSAGVNKVTVEFDVTPQGQTVNPRVVSSTDRCFDRYAIRAVERWKYQPKIVDGEPQPRRGVRTSFKFVLEE
ncbi:MAG: energy transducer TonB [bacterium]